MDALPIARLTGELVSLRAHAAADLDAMLERCLDPDTRRFTTIPLDYTRAHAEEYLAASSTPSTTRISWAIDVDGSYAGTIDLRTIDQPARLFDLGFVTHPAFRGRGVMTEAVALVLDHAFGTVGATAVRWQAHAANVASARAVWRNGFPLPTYVPALLAERGEIHDGWMSTLRSGMPRTPQGPDEDLLAHLRRAG